MQKTNAMRILEREKVPYAATEYELAGDDDHLGMKVADLVGVPYEQVFKTLVLKGGKMGYFVCCIPSDHELDMKKAAVAIGEKSVDMIAVKDLQKITGYIRGGCSPVGMKKNYPVFLDISAESFEYIVVSAGNKGIQMKLKLYDLLRVTSGKIADLAS